MKQWFIVLLSFVLACWGTTARSQVTVDLSNRIGSTATDLANGVAVDASGNIYVTGSFSGTNASFGLNANNVPVTLTSSGSEDIFIIKYNASGVVQWARSAGAPGNNVDRGQKLALDGNGNVFVVGFFRGNATFSSTTMLMSAGGDDAFVAKYNANSGNLIDAANIGGAQTDRANDIAFDANGNFYVAGSFQATVAPNPLTPQVTYSSRGDDDSFVASWDNNLGFRWFVRSGNTAIDEATSIAVSGNNVYVGGRFSGNGEFANSNQTVAASLTSAGLSDAYVAKRDASTGNMIWVNQGGGIQSDYAYDVADDGSGGVVVTGRFAGAANFSSIAAAGASLTSVNGNTGPSDDMFLIRYTGDGDIMWAKSAGGTLVDFATGLSVDATGRVYVSGQFQGAFDFAGSAAHRVSSNGNYDAFFARYDAMGNFQTVVTYGGNLDDRPLDHTLINNRVVAVGIFFNSIQFGTQPVLLSAGGSDGFVLGAQFDVPVNCTLPTPTISGAQAINCQQALSANNFAGATSFTWMRDGLTVPGANLSTFTATQNGNFTVMIANGVPGCTRTSLSFNVSVNSNVSVNAGNDLSINIGQTANLTATVSGANLANVSFTWSGPSGTLGTSSTLAVNPSVSTDYTISVRDNSTGCTALDVVRVNVTGAGCLTGNDIVISIIPGNDNVLNTSLIAEICQGQSSSFQAATLLGNTRYNFRWFRVNPTGGADILASNLNLPVLETQSIDGFYYLQITDNTGACPQVRSGNQLKIETYPIPTVTISSNQVGSGCTDQPVTLTAQGSGGTRFDPANQPENADVNGYRYNWQPADAIVGSSNNNVITANPTIATTFTVQVQDRILCGARATVSVNPALPNITISANGPTSFCTGGSVTLFAALSFGNLGSFTYQWFNGNNQIANQNSSSITVSTAGNYRAVLVSNIAGCPNKPSNTITVSTSVSAIANAGFDRTVCQSQTTSIGFTGQAGVSYNWFPTTGLSNPNASFTSVSGLAPGVYVYTLTSSTANCPPSSDDVVVTVLETPAPIIDANGPTVVCDGVVNLFIVNPIPGINYEWLRNGTPVSSGASISYTAFVSGSYAVRATNASNSTVCPGISSPVQATILNRGTLPIPKIQPFGTGNVNICNDNDLVLFVADSYFAQPEVMNAGDVQVRWLHYPQGIDGNFMIVGDGSRTVRVTEPGIYFAQAYAGADDCIAKKSEGLFVTRSDVQGPSVDAGDDKTVCTQSTACLTAKFTRGMPGRLDINNFMLLNANTNLPAMFESLDIDEANMTVTVCVKPVVSTTYIFMIQDDMTCPAMDDVTVFIKNVDMPDLVGPSSICNNTTGTFEISNAGSFNAFRWLSRPLNSTSNTNWNFGGPVTTSTFSALTANQYAVEASVEGCPWVRSNVISMSLLNAPSQVLISNGNRTICEGSPSFNLNASASANTSGVITYQWNGDAIISNNSNNSSITVQPNVTTTYTVTATNSLGCFTSATTTITVINRPFVAIDGATICSGSSHTFTIGEAIPAGYSVTWQRSSNGNTGFVTVSSVNSASFTTNSAGFYRARLTSNVCIGEVLSNVAQLIVNPTPAAATANARPTDRTICVGEIVELFANGVPSQIDRTYSWFEMSESTNVEGRFLTNNLGTSSNPNVIPNQEVTTTYTLVTTNSVNSCSSSSAVTITVSKEEGPVAFAETDRMEICEGNPVTLAAMNMGNNVATFRNTAPNNQRFYTYRWNGPQGLIENGYGVINYNTASPNVIPSIVTGPLYRTTTFTLTLNDPNTTCVSTCEVEVVVGQRLVASIQRIGGENLCEGEVTLRAISNTGLNVNFQWYTDVNGMDNWTMIPGATGQTFMPRVGGRYNVRVTDPSVSACYDDADNFVTLTGVRSNVNANDLVVNNQFGKPVVQTMPAILCRNQAVKLEARYIFGASYQWYRMDGPSTNPQYTLLENEYNRTIEVSRPGKYIVQVVAGCFACPDVCEVWSQVCPVVVVPEIRPTVHHIGRAEVCQDIVTGRFNSVELNTQGDMNQYAYQWYMGMTPVAGETKTKFVTSTPGTYWVRVTSKFDPTNGANCFGWSNQVVVVPCSTGICPQPISVGAMVDPFSPTTAMLMWTQPLNSSGYNLTGDYVAQFRAVGTTTWMSTSPATTVRATMMMVSSLMPATNYEVRVRSLCTSPTPESAWSFGMFMTPSGSMGCPMPTGVMATATSASTASVTWNDLSGMGVTAYEVQFSVSGVNNWMATMPAVTSANSITITGLMAGTSYDVRARSICDMNSTSGFAVVTNAFVTNGVGGSCEMPMNLAPDQVFARNASFIWEAPTSGLPVNGFDLIIRTEGGATVGVFTSGTTTGNAFGLPSDTELQAFVRTRCTNGSISAEFGPVTFRTAVDQNICNNVSSPGAREVSTGNPIIFWTAGANANRLGYLVYLGTDADITANTATFIPVSDSRLSVNGSEVSVPARSVNTSMTLVDGETYFFGVRDVCAEGEAPVALDGNFQMPGGGPVVIGTNPCYPTSFGVQELGQDGNSVVLSWTNVANVTSYDVRFRRQGVSSYTVLSGVTSPLALTNLEFNMGYEVSLRTNKVGCPSDYTPNILFRTLPDPTGVTPLPACSQPGLLPFTLRCVGLNQALTVNLVPVTGAQGYEFQYRNVGNTVTDWVVTGGDGAPLIIPGTTTTFDVDGLFFENNTVYSFRIRTICSDGSTSRWSNARVVSGQCTPKLAATSADELTFTVYPNPNKGQFTVSVETVNSGQASVRVMDVTGRTIISRVADLNAGNNNVEINATDELSSGLYILQVQVEGQLKTAKLIVE